MPLVDWNLNQPSWLMLGFTPIIKQIIQQNNQVCVTHQFVKKNTSATDPSVVELNKVSHLVLRLELDIISTVYKMSDGQSPLC